MPSIYVETASRKDAEELAWSLLAADVRLAVRGDQWAVQITAATVGESAPAIETVERCVRRLRLGPVVYRPAEALWV